LRELNSPGNPKDCGASLSSQDLSLTPETSRPTPSLVRLGRGMDSVTARDRYPPVASFTLDAVARIPPQTATFFTKNLSLLSLMALHFSAT
jgi:hypothetical protein